MEFKSMSQVFPVISRLNGIHAFLLIAEYA